MADKVYSRIVLMDGMPVGKPSDHDVLGIDKDGNAYISNDDGTGWVLARTLGGGSDLDAVLSLSGGQDIADALTGASSPGSGNVFATIGDLGGGGSSKAFAFFVGG